MHEASQSLDLLRHTIAIRIQLPDTEDRRLEQAFRQASFRKLLDRLRTVRLAHRGRKHKDIAADLGITTCTVQRWLNLKSQCLAAIRSEMQRFCRKFGIRLDSPRYHFLRGDPVKQAEAGELVLPSRDEAPVPMIPTPGATLGVKGQRPAVGTRDCKDLLYAFAVVNEVTATSQSNLLESSARAKQVSGKSKTRQLQEAFAAHQRHVTRLYPVERHKTDVLADHPHLEFLRLPSYSPQLNVIERFWKVLRRRATYNRLFASPAYLKRSIRSSLCYYQTVRDRVRSLDADCHIPPPNRKTSAGL